MSTDSLFVGPTPGISGSYQRSAGCPCSAHILFFLSICAEEYQRVQAVMTSRNPIALVAVQSAVICRAEVI